MKSTPVSADPLKAGVSLAGELQALRTSPVPPQLAFSWSSMEFPHHCCLQAPRPRAGRGRARWKEELAKPTGLGPLPQSWLPRAFLYKHQVLKIGHRFQAFPLLPPQPLRISLALFPKALSVLALWTPVGGTPFMVDREQGATALGSWTYPTVLTPLGSPLSPSSVF